MHSAHSSKFVCLLAHLSTKLLISWSIVHAQVNAPSSFTFNVISSKSSAQCFIQFGRNYLQNYGGHGNKKSFKIALCGPEQIFIMQTNGPRVRIGPDLGRGLSYNGTSLKCISYLTSKWIFSKLGANDNRVDLYQSYINGSCLLHK